MGIKDWIALWKGSQLLAKVLGPKIMLVASKYRSSASMKPKALVMLVWILGNWKHAVISAGAMYWFSS
jgi:hypothetical protein